MKRIAFYSWQSDLPNATNRGFIENALQEAAKQITTDGNIDIEPVIVRDTQGVAGAPDISTTILKKISEANLFVADISFIGKSLQKGKKKYLPNPNVLIELGYAMRAKSPEALVLIFNTAYGKVEDLPFDLKMKRVLTYRAAEGETDRSETKRALTQTLKIALVEGFKQTMPATSATSILDVIKEQRGSKVIELRSYLDRLLTDLDALQPTLHRDGGTAEQLVDALPKTEALVANFGKVCETIVLMNDTVLAKEVFQWFGKMLQRYEPPVNAVSRFSRFDGDFFRVVGHELFVMFVAPFVKEEKWDDIGAILKGDLKVGPTLHYHQGSKQPWTDLSGYSHLLEEDYGKKDGWNRKSYHADTLKKRHTEGELASVVPLKEFLETDFFLFLCGPGSTQEGRDYNWRWYPRSCLWLTHTPQYLLDAADYPTAIKLCHTLQIGATEELQRRLYSSRRLLASVRYSPITDEEINAIGKTGGATILQ